ncbi:MAG: LamG-like jellyroll fold domain-containing protein, partial [Verrucomicrobiota bacterium]
MKTILSFLTSFVLLLSGRVIGQQLLNLQESPPASGLFTARVDDAYSGTGLGSGKVWIFNAEANDRVVFVVSTGVRANSYPVLRVTNAGGGVIAEVGGSADGRCVLNGLVLASPGVYQVSVYSNNTASAFTMQGLLGRGIDLEGEPNDLPVQANPVTATMQAGGFHAGVAGILDGNVDWYDLGELSTGNGVNLSLQTPTGSTLAGAATAVELYKDDETSPLARAMGGALVQTLAASGHYRMAVRMPGLDGGNLHFHGGQSVDLGNPVALQLTDSQTIEFWIRPDDFNSRQNPYAKAYAGEGTMTLETDGTVNYFYGTGGGNNSPYQGFSTGAALRVGQWQHIALVRDFTSTPKQLRW